MAEEYNVQRGQVDNEKSLKTYSKLDDTTGRPNSATKYLLTERQNLMAEWHNFAEHNARGAPN